MKYAIRPLICIIFFLAGCAEIRLNPLPAPPATAKLRVLVLPVTGSRAPERGPWRMPSAEFEEIAYHGSTEILEEVGFYEIIPPEDVQKATGGKEIDAWRWSRNEWQLARDVGRALHADYLMIVMREFTGLLTARLILISTWTGKQYETVDHTVTGTNYEPGIVEAYRKQLRDAHQKIFRQAKGDMLETAIRKGNPSAGKPGLPAREVARKDEKAAPAAISRAASEKKTAEAGHASGRMAGPGRPEERQAALPGEAPGKKVGGPKADGTDSARQRLLIYDFQTTRELSTVALILSEALREEFSALGRFDLINRADANKALQELKLQKSGLGDDQQTLQIGKWLVANHTITGTLGIIGNTLILQSRMTELQTMKILTQGSIRASVGKEEDLLHALPGLVKKLYPQ